MNQATVAPPAHSGKELAEKHAQIVGRYLDQPAKMPAALRERIEKSFGGKPVQLYALADLDASMKLSRTWLALGPEQICLAHEDTDGGAGPLRAFERSRVKEIRKVPGLSCTTVTFMGAPDEPALGVVRFTHRQRRAVENVCYVIEEQIKGQSVEAREPDALYAESLAQAILDAQNSVSANRMGVVWRLLSYLKPYRVRVAYGMIAAGALTLLGLVPPFLTGYLIDKVIRPYDAGAMPRETAWNIAWLTIAGIAATYVLREVCVWVRLRSMAVMGELVSRDLRTELYEHLQTLSVSYFSSKRTGSLISRVSSDTDRLWEFVAFGIVEVSLSMLTIVSLGAVLMCLDWRLGLLLAAPVPILFYAIHRHGQGMEALFTRAWRKWSAVTDVLSDTIPGMRVVKAFHQEDQEKKRFGARNEDVTSEFNRIHATWTVFWPLLMLAIHVLIIGVWAFGLPRMLGVYGAALSAGTFVSFLLYASMFVQPIEVLGQMSRMLNRATSSAHRIFEVLDTEPEIVEVENAIELNPVSGRVTFDRVQFSYDGVRQVLKGVSFDVQPGEMIGLVGPSGGGKTTVTNLIVRFYDANGGSISIDGVDIKQLDPGHFRRQVGMVLQDPYLFHGPVLENIRYGNPDAPIDRVVEAARAANAHDFICKLPHGYDTIVGERGHTLSGGERQRVSIARAILTDPRILILDEATSSVDTETEQKIQEALDRLIAGRTVFAIAHRLSTLKRATRLFVIEDGKISEQGTHGELLAKENGTYRKLCSMQQQLHEMYAV
jgi:ATP-binding cassette subfamily B protein